MARASVIGPISKYQEAVVNSASSLLYKAHSLECAFFVMIPTHSEVL